MTVALLESNTYDLFRLSISNRDMEVNGQRHLIERDNMVALTPPGLGGDMVRCNCMSF